VKCQKNNKIREKNGITEEIKRTKMNGRRMRWEVTIEN
jgi:hypothetical protein